MVKTQVSDTGMVRTALVIKNRKLNPNQSEQKRSVLGHITHSQEQGPLQDNLVWASKESACQPRVSAPLGLPYDGSSSFNSMFLQHPVQWRTRECPFGSDGVICLSLCQIPWPRGVLSTGFIARRRVRGWPPTDGLAWALGGTARASPPTEDPASFTPPFVPSFPTCLRHVCSGVPGRATGHTASQCPGDPSVVRKGRQRCQFKVNALGVKGTQEPPERAPCSQCWKGECSSQQNKVVLITTRSVK